MRRKTVTGYYLLRVVVELANQRRPRSVELGGLASCVMCYVVAACGTFFSCTSYFNVVIKISLKTT